MDQHDDRSGRIRRESELSSDLDCVLSAGNRAEIDEILLDTAYNLKRTFEKGDTVYHLILRNDELTEEDIIAISEIFRARGVNPNTVNKEQNASVHYAIQNRMRDVTNFFMRCRWEKSRKALNNTFTKFFVEDENERFWDKARRDSDKAELWDSEEVESKSASFLEWLISKERNFHRRNKEGISSIEVAIGCDLQHLLPVLLSRLADPLIQQSTYLQQFLGKSSPARRSHGRRSRYHFKNRELWYSGYKSRYASEIVQILLNKGAPVLDPWMKCVQIAIRDKEDIDIIKLLLDHFPSDCDESSTATSSFRQLMEYSLADRTDSEIHCYRQILNDLVAKGADVEQKYDREMTAVQVAITKKNVHAVIWFNEIGANFDVLTSKAQNLLHLLVTEHRAMSLFDFRDEKAEKAKKAIVDLLVDKGFQVNASDSEGATPLHLAAKCSDRTMARKLIERGADVNCRDNRMQTPLFYAAFEYSALDTIKFLLESGANANAKDSRGESLYFRAVAGVSFCGAHAKVLRSLVKWGAPVNTLFKFDEDKIVGFARIIDVDTFRELLEYGLDVNNSRFYNSLYDRRRRIATILEQHCIKLKAAELHCSEDYSSRSGDKQKCQDYYEECLKEIETLKSTFIDSRTSLYDFLRMSRVCKRAHINNEKLKSLVDSPNLEKQFPRYSVLVLAGYREAVSRKSLVEPAKTAWLELTEISLPDICIERILSYLSNVDLVNMIEW